ncbi:MAG: alpha/beta hydrolase, partial [Spirochaetes bacterium]|nr:alpha/beta hydrolase [Spirochaetota bacterium]
YLADLLQDIKKLKLKKPPLIMGHSFGSLLTQMIATKIKIKGFILLTPVPPGGICIWKPSVIRIFAEVIAKWAFWRKPFRFTYRTAVFGLMKLLPPEKRKRYYNNLLHESGRAGVETGFYFFDPNKTAFVDRTRIKGPGLIIAAKKDRMMPASLARKTLKRYKDVIDIEYREYPNHAHWIMDEPGWQKVAQDIYDWIVKILKKDKRKKQVPSG